MGVMGEGGNERNEKGSPVSNVCELEEEKDGGKRKKNGEGKKLGVSMCEGWEKEKEKKINKKR